MSGKLTEEARMTIKELVRRGWSNVRIAAALAVTEGSVRYHRRRQARGAVDGRSLQRRLASRWAEPIDEWMSVHADRGVNLAELHSFLVGELEYPGSLRSVERYVRDRYPAPKRRARRRVETPPGGQAQADWAEFRNLLVGGRSETLYAFHLQLSWSRYDAVVWSSRKDQLSWLTVHNEGLRKLGGVPATVRVDNEKTAVVRGAGPWSVLNPVYRRYAESVRFHVDPCLPGSPEAKGKVERRILDHRLRADPRGRHWDDMGQLQRWTDVRVTESAQQRVCPASGDTVIESWEAEKQFLAPLPVLPEAFDVVVTRRVAKDCTVQFESHSYSVPFRLIGRMVEVRGCVDTVQVFAGSELVASHPRHTRPLIVLDPRHFEGQATEDVLPPMPLGRMGRRLEEIASMPPEQRPIDLYAALAEVRA